MVLSAGPRTENQVDVMFDGSQFVTVWFEVTSPSLIGTGNIRGRRVSAAGVADGDAFDIDTSSLLKTTPKVGRVGGTTLVVWGSQGSGLSRALMGRRLAPDGTLVDGMLYADAQFISGHPPGGSRYIYPQIVSLPDRALIPFVDKAFSATRMKSVEGVLFLPW
jgi:hypothetical protein